MPPVITAITTKPSVQTAAVKTTKSTVTAPSSSELKLEISFFIYWPLSLVCGDQTGGRAYWEFFSHPAQSGHATTFVETAEA